MKHTGICVVSLLSGMMIGSAIALLFAPQKGSDLRHQIKDAVGNGVDHMKQKIKELENKIEEGRCHCEQ